MTQENAATVRRILEAFNTEDIERILVFADPEVEVEIPPELSAEPDVYHGHDGMRRYWESFQEVMEDIRFEAGRLWHVDEVVVVVMHLTAKGRHTAIPVEQRVAGVWTMRGGRVTRIRAYASLSEALEAVGLTE
jgi:ketosteroid isomerase-like protein